MSGYSTGMRQRAKLAQALVHDPQLVFLDEPTNGLDPAGRDEMLELIERTGRVRGISIVMATHLLGEIERVCDQLIVIDAGRLLHQGALADFTAATRTLEVELVTDAHLLAARLETNGFGTVLDGQRVLVTIDAVPPFDFIRDSVADLGLGLIRIQQRRHTLEDLFRIEAIAAARGEDAS
jgi:ABC-2 type transport system ATP-binding protein